MEKISNSILTVEISEHGAELQSIKKNGKEYLWQGDANFWGRRSPVLFPNVGRVWNDKYTHMGNTYEIGQHGFARDMDFQVTYKDDEGIVYWLESTPDTLGKFPFPFRLMSLYRFDDDKLKIIRIMANHIVDLENHYDILMRLDFDSNKRKALDILNVHEFYN